MSLFIETVYFIFFLQKKKKNLSKVCSSAIAVLQSLTLIPMASSSTLTHSEIEMVKQNTACVLPSYHLANCNGSNGVDITPGSMTTCSTPFLLSFSASDLVKSHSTVSLFEVSPKHPLCGSYRA